MAQPSQSSAAVDELLWSDPFDIELGWLDYNGHLNMAYYHVMFDRTVDLALAAIGMGRAYRDENNASVFNVETHVVYRREVSAHDKVRVSIQLVGRDEKRLHVFQTMVRIADDELAATSESLFVHVDLTRRKASPLPERVLEAADAMIARQSVAGVSAYAGRRIAPLR